MQIEDLKMKTSNLEIKNIYRTVNPETCDKYVSGFISLLNDEITNKHQFTKIKKDLSKKYSINPSVATMNYSYYKLFQIDVLIYAKTQIPPWVRLNRVIRDFPHYYILDGNNKPNLRQDVLSIMKDAIEMMNHMKLFVRSYEASNGTEYFISFESPDNKYIYLFFPGLIISSTIF